jgi:hypothetical protein
VVGGTSVAAGKGVLVERVAITGVGVSGWAVIVGVAAASVVDPAGAAGLNGTIWPELALETELGLAVESEQAARTRHKLRAKKARKCNFFTIKTP